VGCLLALTAALVLGPAGALACSPTSAGDCQYTDPLGNTTTSTTTTTHQPAPPPVTTAPPPVTTAPATVPQFTAPATTAPDPTTTTTAVSAGKTLPYTGYDAWIGGALGVFLVAGGIAVRRRYATR